MAVRQTFCALLCMICLAVGAGSARADAEAESAVKTWLDAVASGDRARLAAVLAPEFQIQRANGVGHGKPAYVGGGAAKISQIQEVSDVIPTRHQDLLVVRYKLAVAETVDGHKVERKAPRLTVFRRDGKRWLVVAHANFARIE